MTTNKRDKQYAIVALSVLYTLVLGSLIAKFNMIDLIYSIILSTYIIRYIYSNYKKIVSNNWYGFLIKIRIHEKEEMFYDWYPLSFI